MSKPKKISPARHALYVERRQNDKQRTLEYRQATQRKRASQGR